LYLQNAFWSIFFCLSCLAGGPLLPDLLDIPVTKNKNTLQVTTNDLALSLLCYDTTQWRSLSTSGTDDRTQL